jgi:hypothetical protein
MESGRAVLAVGLTRGQVEEIIEAYFHELSAPELDKLFAKHVGDFDEPKAVFKRVRKALES